MDVRNRQLNSERGAPTTETDVNHVLLRGTAGQKRYKLVIERRACHDRSTAKSEKVTEIVENREVEETKR